MLVLLALSWHLGGRARPQVGSRPGRAGFKSTAPQLLLLLLLLARPPLLLLLARPLLLLLARPLPLVASLHTRRHSLPPLPRPRPLVALAQMWRTPASVQQMW
jgi:hypothetical protein